jgi:hypothetical protein
MFDINLLKYKEEFYEILEKKNYYLTRYGYLTVDPNIDPDPKIVPYSDPTLLLYVFCYLSISI